MKAASTTLSALAVFVSYAYFYQAGGWNQNARFDLSRAIAERGTIRIDAYHQNTGDKSLSGGHFYSNKAPGQSLLAVPVAAAGAWLAWSVGADPGQRGPVTAISYAATVLTSALPAALMLFAIARIARLRGRSSSAERFAGLALALATPMWAYATLMMGHALSASCLLAAALAAEALRQEGSSRRDLALGLGVGGAAGWAVVTEYPALAPATLLALYALWQVRASWSARAPRVAVGLALGSGLCASLLFAYHQAAFGSPFATSLGSLYGFAAVSEQPFSLPSAAVLLDLFFGARRGLLPLAPVLIASLAGFWHMLRNAETRPLGVLCIVVIGYYALMNAAFATPLAGWSYGPRYMAAALPFWGLGLLFAWDASRRRAWRALLVVLALWGAGCSLVAVSTTAQPPRRFERPMAELLWPAFLAGDLSLNHVSFQELRAKPLQLRGGTLEHDAFNLGELVGLRGHASLVPLYATWATAAALLWRRRSTGPAGGG